MPGGLHTLCGAPLDYLVSPVWLKEGRVLKIFDLLQHWLKDVNHSYPLDFVTLFVCELNRNTSEDFSLALLDQYWTSKLCSPIPNPSIDDKIDGVNQSGLVRTRELFRLWLQVGTYNSGVHWERKWREQTTVRPGYTGPCRLRYAKIKVQQTTVRPRYIGGSVRSGSGLS